MSQTSTIAPSATFTQQFVRPLFRTSLRLPPVSTWHAPHRGLVQITNIGWDPEVKLGPPVPHYITRRSSEKKIAEDSEYEENAERLLQAEKEALWQAREARALPITHKDLLEFFLTTEGQEMEFEIARCRPWFLSGSLRVQMTKLMDMCKVERRLFAFLNSEIGSLRFPANKTAEVEDRVAELEVLRRFLLDGIEAYDELAADLTGAKERLLRIFFSRNKSKTLLEMAGNNEIDRSLLALLDENIATATKENEEQAAVFMEEIRGAVVKYITL